MSTLLNFTRGFPAPREFQIKAHDQLRAGFSAGHRCQLLNSATGSGKTYMGLRIANEAILKGKRALFVCDRTTLINQTSETADRYGMTDHGIIQAKHWRCNSSAPFQIASVQTLGKRGFWPRADVVIIDEAHTQYKPWVEFVQHTDAAVIGLSATPFSAGLGKIFSNLVNAISMDELTRTGVLVPLRMRYCTPTDMKGAATVGGEWTDKAAEERGMKIVGDVVAEWQSHGEGRKTIVFGSTIAHCEELARQFNQAGILAAVFTSHTTAPERQMLLDEYRKEDSALRVLISVEALAKGFDVPDVGCVVDCRPLRKSLSTAIQMWGRGLRSSPETGKQDCILLDQSGNIQRFMEDFSDLYFNGLSLLDEGEKLDKKIRKDDDYEPKGCPSCGFKPFIKRCISCGHERKVESLVEHVSGESVEVMLGKKVLAPNHRNLWEQLCSYAKTYSAADKQYWRAWSLYKNIVGSPPPKSWEFNNAFVEVTNNTHNKIRSLNIAYKKARQAA